MQENQVELLGLHQWWKNAMRIKSMEIEVGIEIEIEEDAQDQITEEKEINKLEIINSWSN